jgi:DNA (cytosine-5)-methyltransferase 1
MNAPHPPLTFVDLFCGCGGFSLGMQRAGLRCLAGLDSNPEAIAVFRTNFPRVPQVLEKDLTRFPPPRLAALLETDTLDVIVGGPPCQGFSTVRQVDGANHGSRLVHDDRRHLYREFLR